MRGILLYSLYGCIAFHTEKNPSLAGRIPAKCFFAVYSVPRMP